MADNGLLGNPLNEITDEVRQRTRRETKMTY